VNDRHERDERRDTEYSPAAPHEDDDVILRALERRFADERLPDDDAAIARWIAADPRRQRVVDELHAQWGTVPAAHDVDAGWSRMAGRIQRASSDSEASTGARSLHRAPPRFAGQLGAPKRLSFRIAAAACAAAAIVLATRLVAPTAVHPPVATAAERTYATSAGQRAEIRLADGTQVILAPESRVRVPSDFGVHRRDVHVEGEAYFVVVHDSTRPFTVFAANASVRDIGTAFAVRSYPEDGAVRVVVREGLVAMSGAGLLAAGDLGQLTADGKASVRHGVDVQALLGWTDGKLAFEDAPLRQVLHDLRRWHGVAVRLADSTLADLPFTGSADDVSPDEALRIVAATLGLRVRQNGPSITIGRR
jgi:transmembrane sensor